LLDAATRVANPFEKTCPINEVLSSGTVSMRSNTRFFGRRTLALGSSAILLLAAMGCGGGKGDVSGTVTLDGKPLPAGKIAFLASKGAAVSADIQNGQYTVAKVPTGNVKVTVETASIKTQADQMQAGIRQGGPKSVPPNTPPEAKAHLEAEIKANAESAQKAKDLLAQYRPIPEKYGKPDTSGLSTTVKAGDNKFDVSLTSK
jgi:hypothetical protein